MNKYVQIAVETGAVGLASLVVANLLQYGYKVTDFYPPNQVFYFAIGATTHLILEMSGLNSKYANYKVKQLEVSA